MSLSTWKLQSRMASITSFDACSLNIMVDPAGTARGSRNTPSGYASWIAATPACLIIAILVLACGVICWCQPAQGAELKLEDQIPVPATPLSFEDSVKLAIHRSPYFTL
jgi:hypothetical protein